MMRSLIAVLVIVLLWTAGLMAFADRVVNSTPAEEPEKADAIVALTGASDMRIREAMRLLERRKGERLLVSGVNKVVTRDELREVADGSRRSFDCCVDLGFDAVDTVGNAEEIAAWARAKGFDSLIVVTSDYHMPRSLVEIRGALPGVTLAPYPVTTPALDARNWWKTSKGMRIMMLEYSKFLAILAREAVLGLSRATHKSAEPDPAQPKVQDPLNAPAS